ncbi:MAG: hypothetical protein HXY44_03480 [Syntrophaceae bacterium]|nr:hypothetical protein [Syntrophaceae bacterium]
MGRSDEKIEVIAYSGFRGEETPRTIFLNEKKIGVLEILKMWTEEGIKDRRRKRFFKVKGSDGSIYTVYYDEKFMDWFCKVEE